MQRDSNWVTYAISSHLVGHLVLPMSRFDVTLFTPDGKTAKNTRTMDINNKSERSLHPGAVKNRV